MTTTLYNKFKNTEFKDVNNLGYAIKSFGNIINNATLNTNLLEIGQNGTNFSFIDIKTTGGNSDFDVRLGCSGGLSTSSGQGVLSLNCASATVSSNLIVSGSITCNSIISSSTTNITNYSSLSINGSFNNSYYYSIKGKTYNNASLNTYTNESTLYNGTTNTASYQEIQVPTTCLNVKISYSFDSSITNYQVQAAVEYVFYKNVTTSYWTFGKAYEFGTNTFPPTITIVNNVLKIIYPANSSLTGYINYSFGIWLI